MKWSSKPEMPRFRTPVAVTIYICGAKICAVENRFGKFKFPLKPPLEWKIGAF
jgi:hypothetical protein